MTTTSSAPTGAPAEITTPELVETRLGRLDFVVGATTLTLGPRAPRARQSNWIQTVPGKGWFAVLRLYGTLLPFFDKTWRPSEIVASEQAG